MIIKILREILANPVKNYQPPVPPKRGCCPIVVDVPHDVELIKAMEKVSTELIKAMEKELYEKSKQTEKVGKLRKAHYVDEKGVGRCFTSKHITIGMYSLWLGTSHKWKALEFDSQYGSLYKTVGNVLQEARTGEGNLVLPMLEARIAQLKKLTRGKRSNLKPSTASKLDQELGKLRSLARQHQVALEWVNSDLPFCYFIEKRFPNTPIGLHTNPIFNTEMYAILRASARLFV